MYRFLFRCNWSFSARVRDDVLYYIYRYIGMCYRVKIDPNLVFVESKLGPSFLCCSFYLLLSAGEWDFQKTIGKKNNYFFWVKIWSHYVAQHAWTKFWLNFGPNLPIFFPKNIEATIFIVFSAEFAFSAHPQKIMTIICEHECANLFLAFLFFVFLLCSFCVRLFVFFGGGGEEEEWKTTKKHI